MHNEVNNPMFAYQSKQPFALSRFGQYLLGMTIAELEKLPNVQAIAVDNNTGHAIAIVRAEEGYLLYDGNSMTAPYTTEIRHPTGANMFSIDEVRQMFATRKFSIVRGFLPD